MKCIKEIPMFKVTMNPAVDETLLPVLHSGWIGQGPKVAEFETHLWKKFNNPNVLSLSAGTHGLSLALRLAGIKYGDEVITTPLTCQATVMPILMHGGKIVWADVKEDFNINPVSIEKNITDKTKAIIVVHWGGYPCDMEEIYNIAENHNIKVIEDCAHVWGSTYKDSVIGDCEYSDFAMFSFQAIKHLTSVTPETPVLIRKNGITKLVEIGSLDKTIIGNECMSFTYDGKTKWSKIYDFIKHSVSEPLLNIKLEKGRQVNITKNHSVYTYKNGKFLEVFGSDLKIGDYLAVPRKLNITDNIIKKIDLLELLKHKTLMIHDNQIRLNYEGRGGNSGKWINRYLNIDEDFCKILGYYVAEGSITKSYSRNGKITDNSPLSCIFSMGTHEEYTRIQDLIDCLERKFPIYKAQKYKVNKNKTGIKVHFGSTLFAEIIKAMNPGNNTYEKRIPDIIWSVSDSCKESFLKGYFNGDGHERCQDGYTIYQQWTSASKELTNGIHYLLLSMGKQTSSLELNEGYKLNKKEEKMNRYSGYIINYDGQETCKENCIPNEFVTKYNYHNSFTIERIKNENFNCPEELLKDIALLKINEINEFYYDGYVYDFSVEEVENFIGGFGAICLHNTVDGGALCTRSQHDYDRGKLLRWYGINREGSVKDMRCSLDNQVHEWGYKYHMNDVNATIGMANIDHADENVRTARENADYYEDMFNDIDGIECTQVAIDRRSSYWLFTVLVEDRTSFVHMMGSNGIAVSRVHERVDKHAFAKDFQCDLPMLEEVVQKMICIPVGYWVSEEDREYIVEAIKGGW